MKKLTWISTNLLACQSNGRLFMTPRHTAWVVSSPSTKAKYGAVLVRNTPGRHEAGNHRTRVGSVPRLTSRNATRARSISTRTSPGAGVRLPARPLSTCDLPDRVWACGLSSRQRRTPGTGEPPLHGDRIGRSSHPSTAAVHSLRSPGGSRADDRSSRGVRQPRIWEQRPPSPRMERRRLPVPWRVRSASVCVPTSGVIQSGPNAVEANAYSRGCRLVVPFVPRGGYTGYLNAVAGRRACASFGDHQGYGILWMGHVWERSNWLSVQ